MKNKNTSKRSKGRPKYIADIPKLKELYKKLDKNEITNEERMAESPIVARPNGIS